MDVIEVSGGCGPNVGGIVTFELVAIEDILSMPVPDESLVIDTGIELKPGTTYTIVKHVDDGADASEALDTSANGTAYKVSLNCSMGSRTDSAILRWCRLNERRRFVALVKDGNGVTRVYGTVEQPLTLSHENMTGRLGSDRHDHVLRLQGKCRRPAPLYEPPTFLIAGGTSTNYFLISDLSSYLTANA